MMMILMMMKSLAMMGSMSFITPSIIISTHMGMRRTTIYLLLPPRFPRVSQDSITNIVISSLSSSSLSLPSSHSYSVEAIDYDSLPCMTSDDDALFNSSMIDGSFLNDAADSCYHDEEDYQEMELQEEAYRGW
jgi:hypothetical protein